MMMAIIIMASATLTFDHGGIPHLSRCHTEISEMMMAIIMMASGNNDHDDDHGLDDDDGNDGDEDVSDASHQSSNRSQP